MNFFKKLSYMGPANRLVGKTSVDFIKGDTKAIEAFNEFHTTLHKKTGLCDKELSQFIKQEIKNTITSISWSIGFVIDSKIFSETPLFSFPLMNKFNVTIGPVTLLTSVLIGVSYLNQLKVYQKEDGTFEINNKLDTKKSIFGSLLSFLSSSIALSTYFLKTGIEHFLSFPILLYINIQFGVDKLFNFKKDITDEDKLKDIIDLELTKLLEKFEKLGYK